MEPRGPAVGGSAAGLGDRRSKYSAGEDAGARIASAAQNSNLIGTSDDFSADWTAEQRHGNRSLR